MMNYKPVGLIILDGLGIREMAHGNAVAQARTPNYDRWLRSLERSILDASGEAVGLPADQMGNSEVGHLNLGAGRIVYQDLTRIDKAIENGEFFQNVTLIEGLEQVRAHNGNLHLIGLLGPGGVHSHSRHLYALLQLAREHQVEPVLHLITDGRDTPPRSGIHFLEALEQKLAELGTGTIASISGRYYTMDRDKRWQRTEQGYRVIARRDGPTAASARQVLEQSYGQGVTDEFVIPTVIEVDDGRELRVQPGDCLVFFNFRADRMRQIVTAFANPEFDGFERPFIEKLSLVTLTSYEDNLPVQVVFADEEIDQTLAEVISEQGLSQFHAAETEKYAHVTYFFNGGKETAFAGEERLLVPSPQVATYDLQPEMSAYELADRVLERLQTHDDAFILVNFANPDMVGHTGVLEAAVRACEVVDECAGRLVQAILDKGGVALVTADHGNAERMIDEASGNPHTYHTTNPVSFLIIGDTYFAPRPRGILADVAPTVLELLGIKQPEVMDGRSLLEHAGL
jgi:2,3-bisphosphoglycerate-independent phosphoglycerate mutase